jgi:hypothetical protein
MNDMELDAYERLTHALAWEPDVFVYLKAEPETCHARCMARARDGEECIPLSYLQSLHTQYNNLCDYLKERGCPVVTLDVEGPQDGIEAAFVSNVHRRLSTADVPSEDRELSSTPAEPSPVAASPLKPAMAAKVVMETAERAARDRDRMMSSSDEKSALLPHRAIGPDYTKELVARLCRPSQITVMETATTVGLTENVGTTSTPAE